MAEKVQVDVEVNADLEPTIANLKKLKKQLKETAAGSAEFNKLSAQIRDMDDALKDAAATSDDFAGYLENASGPLGVLGKGIRAAEKNFSSFNAVLKASVIGLIVSAIGGLVAAFSQSERATKKLQPLLIGLEKILGGIFAAVEPLFDAFIDLATKALPYVTKGISTAYSAITSFLQGLGKLAEAVGKLIKGDFTGAWESAKESVTGFGKRYNEATARFESGTKELTKTEKEELEKRQKANEEAAAKRKALLEKQQKEAEEARKKREEANKAADEVELEAFKATLSEREREEYEAGERLAEERAKLAAAGRTDMTGIEEQYRIKLAEIKKKYDDKEAEEKKKKDDEDKEKLKKKLEEERGIILTNLQSKFEDLDRENQKVEFDFQQDLERLRQQRDILAQQEATELQNTELTEFQKTEIRKKYADARMKITDQEIATEKAAAEAKHQINMAYLGLFEQFGNLLGQIAGENKAIAIAGIVISQAAAIGQIIANTAIANAKAVAAMPLTLGQPWVTINTISAGLSIASTIAAAAKSIQQINSQPGGSGGGTSAAGTTSAPPVTYKGAPGAAPTPQITTNGGQNPTSQIAETMAAAKQAPVRAYVVSGDVSSQQALDRRTSVAATFS